MPIQRVLAIVAGKVQEYVARDTSTGAANAGSLVALNSAGAVDQTMLPTGVGPDVAVVNASEALAAGAYVNFWSNSGAFAARNADGSATGKQADGFVLAAVASGAAATVYLAGLNTSVSGQVPGFVYLGTTPGQGATTGASAAGQTYQVIGVAVSATAVQFDPQTPIVRA